MKISHHLSATLIVGALVLQGCGGSGGGGDNSSAAAAAEPANTAAALDTGAATASATSTDDSADARLEAERLRARTGSAGTVSASGAAGTATGTTTATATSGAATAGGTASTTSTVVAATTSSATTSSSTGASTASTTSTASTASTASTSPSTTTTTTPTPTTPYDAWRLADQATFGPTESLLATIKTQGPEAWLKSQFALNNSRYTSGGTGDVHQWTSSTTNYCDSKPATCWRDNWSSIPLVWDFYRNAVSQPDQLRQRVALALQQIVVTSGLQLEGTYGFRNYQNALLTNAFGNYADVLRSVILSPVMGDYLNGVNNDKAAPNENFARELLQLFSLGNCLLNADGSLAGGKCTPTYDNTAVRSYAYAMTGWTYPAGGSSPWGCWPAGTNCRFYNGDMVPAPTLHDTTQRTLLSGVTVPAGSAAPASLGYVLSSLMAHPNIAPFISKQLIQHLVTSNPSPAYVQRVANAFTSGRYAGGTASFGSSNKGDLTATVAAVLLDAEARGPVTGVNSGKLREPVLMFTGVIRQYAGKTDGDALAWWWGDTMRQHIFRPPSVFNFYSPSFPVAGTGLMGPSFALHGASAALNRLNYLTFVIDWDGLTADTSVPGATGTHIDLTGFTSDALDAAKLVDRLSQLAIGHELSAAVRTKIIAAVDSTSSSDKLARTKTAAYLVLATPDWQVEP